MAARPPCRTAKRYKTMRTMLWPQRDHLGEAGATTQTEGAHSFKVSIGVVMLSSA